MRSPSKANHNPPNKPKHQLLGYIRNKKHPESCSQFNKLHRCQHTKKPILTLSSIFILTKQRGPNPHFPPGKHKQTHFSNYASMTKTKHRCLNQAQMPQPTKTKTLNCQNSKHCFTFHQNPSEKIRTFDVN